VEVFKMSFDEDEKNFKGRDPGERDSYNMDNGGKKPRNSGDDFFKDEDFELEGYKDEEVESEGFRSKRIKEKRKKGKKFFRIIAIMLALVVVATGVVFWVIPLIKSKLPSEVEIPEEMGIIIPESLELGQDINLVIACAGENLLEPEVSSIIFSSYYSSEEALISLCIPVRTLMDIPGIGAELVGETVKVGGMDLLSLTLEKNLGMDMKIDYYILLDVYNVVNKLGGIDLELDEEITVKNYDDGSTFKLEKGKNPVDGTKAVNFLKYFSGNDKEVPIENVTKQKLLFDAIISKIAGESDEKLSDNLSLIKDFIDTDLSMEERLKIFSTFSIIEADKNLSYALNISSTTELGEGIVYIPDVSKLAEIFKKEGTAPEEVAAVEETVNLTILNGVGTPGLAAEVSELLKSQVFESGKSKYNILKAENADNSNYDTTEILVYSDQSYVIEAANDIKNILEVGNIIAREDEGANSDIIIVLGADYKAKAAEKAVSEEVAQIIKINILNGEGTAKLAFTVKGIIESYFNEDGKILEVVETKDADNWNYTQTKIIIFTSGEGVNTLAQQLQERLGVGVIEYSDNNVDNVDISIILGSDYTNK
jgi:anionic cell wall polymer biosynthesis LytR-Cps2A-Psr (LCP) family protein